MNTLMVMVNLFFDRDSIRAVDRAAIEEYGIPGIVLMENAARGQRSTALSMLGLRGPSGQRMARVLIVCGAGNNGGDGYAVARHLHNAGAEVLLLPLGEPRAESDAGINAAICRKMNLRHISRPELVGIGDISLIIDAIFGTGLDRPVTGEAAEMIAWMNAAHRPILAADVPSGLDCNTGQVLGAAVRATRTATFGGMKVGFRASAAMPWLGDVEVVDIGVPRELLERFGRPSQQE